MNSTEKNPFELMGELFAKMTFRAMNAEKEAEDAKRDATSWYQRWCDTDAKLTDTVAKLADTEKKLDGSLRKTIVLQTALKKVQDELDELKKQTETATGAHVDAPETRNSGEGTETHPNTENARDSATNAENIHTGEEQHGTL